MLRRLLCHISFGYLVLLLAFVLFVLISATYRVLVSPEQFNAGNGQQGAAIYMLLFTVGVAVYLALGVYVCLVLRKNAWVLSAGLFYILFLLFAVAFLAPSLYYLLGFIAYALN